MRQDTRTALYFALAGALLYLPFLGGVHLFDWDEINFAEISREMVVLGEYVRVYINFEPFWEKPPLFFWLQALAMSVFGVGEYAARFPNAVCGIITLPLLFHLGSRIYDQRMGLLWAGAYFGSVLPFLYFKSGIIDPWFNLFIFLGLYFFILGYWKHREMPGILLSRPQWVYFILGGAAVGLGALTKGPVAYLIPVLCMGAYWVFQGFRMYVHIPQFLVFSGSVLAVASLWYAFFFADNFQEFIAYQYRLLSTPDAGHGGFPGYHFVVLLFGCFPASVFAVQAFFDYRSSDTGAQKDFRKWMKILFWTVLILFSLVQSKIVHYSSLAYFPLTFLAAHSLHRIWAGTRKASRWEVAGTIGIGGLYILLLLIIPFAGTHIEMIAPLFQKDPFAMANLEAKVHWTGWEWLPTVALAPGILFFIRNIRSGRVGRGSAFLFGGTALFVMLTLIALVKRIEGYSQRAAIEFFAERKGEDCYLLPYGYKTYAHLFYAAPQQSGKACFLSEECQDFVLYGDIDKPAYIISKIHKAGELSGRTDIQEIGRKNGFVFFRRMPAGSYFKRTKRLSQPSI